MQLRLYFLFTALILTKLGFSQNVYTRTLKLMGSRFDITVVADTPNNGNHYIDLAVEEIRRIEKLISSWDQNSQTSAINKNAGIKPIAVNTELFKLISRAITLSQLTDGAFDITYASMDRIWKFDGTMESMPSSDVIQKSIEKVGFSKVILNTKNQKVFLPLKGMKIGFGAIGKGYAADKAKSLLQSKGVIAGIINASGDMNTWGKHPNGSDWTVAIVNPLDKNNVMATLPIKNQAVVTSGNYEKFVVFKDKRYSHIIDPRTGYPSSEIISATVFAPKAELADALATSVFVMGIQTGINRINQLPNVECILIDNTGKIHTSKHIKINTK